MTASALNRRPGSVQPGRFRRTAAGPLWPPRRPGAVSAPPTAPQASAARTLDTWLSVQSLNALRHAAALRPFAEGEFGAGAPAPSAGHLQATNALIGQLRRSVLELGGRVGRAVAASRRSPTPAVLARTLTLKEQAHDTVRATEKVWDFYFELFGQRQSRYGFWLDACDQIALDCYQHTWVNLGKARSVPAPPPFSFMRTGFSPATYRRGIPLSRLGRLPNPFPLIQLPYHRLVNPWTLGAVLHEVSHNLHSDLGLSQAVPAQIEADLLRAGASPEVAATWRGWNRESYADLSGLLLGGPCVVASLMDVVGRSPAATYQFTPGKPHPTPYIRVLLSCALLRRMGFPEEAARYRRAWTALYPNPRAGIPAALLHDLGGVLEVVVNAVCYTAYPQLGRPLAGVLRFSPKDQLLIEEAAGRLARGVDPGVLPERYLIGAVRVAAERRLASPSALTEHFYREISRR
ncbi:hypothetical protein [Deinococcus altitudinis]|uniref:hypothetical protein n=1 Tax=Deinococcus altitudinis TaxID=468914 RepID=UPI0038921672